jgi:UrcA family protein
MNTHDTRRVPVSRRRIAMAMMVCGMAGPALIGAASAATAADDAPSIAVRYNPQSLDTESGARELYGRLVQAAAEVCPQGSDSPRWISDAVRECRAQSVSRAVLKVNNARLAAVYATSAKSG